MPEPLVRATGLGKVYRIEDTDVIAVRDATFEVHPGARIALVGPSGSGKSTLLHLMAALDHPSSGSIEWPALGPRERLRPAEVAMAFQGPSLLPPLTIAENVALPLLLMDRPEDEALRRSTELIGRFGLEDVASKLPEEISGGQSQRAAVARALAGRPRLLLADEPTGQQDGSTAAAVMATLLERCTEEAVSLVVATHDLRVARRLESRWSIRAGMLVSGAVPSSR